MIVPNRAITRCNASAQHVIICIKPLIILIPPCVDPDVLMGQERAEYDSQAMQALQCACALFISCMQTMLNLFAVFLSTILASKPCRTNLLIWRCHGLTVADRPIRILIVHQVIVEHGWRSESAHRTLAIQDDSVSRPGTDRIIPQEGFFWLEY